jgi:hypothetical protein
MAVSMAERFQIGVTRDFLKPDGSLGFGDIGLSLLDANPNIAWKFLPVNEPVLQLPTATDCSFWDLRSRPVR